jgi:hypothetical protein
MTKQERIRAEIIAAQAAREAASATAKDKPRSKSAPSPLRPPRKPFGRGPTR